jgi:hypothetical protein
LLCTVEEDSKKFGLLASFWSHDPGVERRFADSCGFRQNHAMKSAERLERITGPWHAAAFDSTAHSARKPSSPATKKRLARMVEERKQHTISTKN